MNKFNLKSFGIISLTVQFKLSVIVKIIETWLQQTDIHIDRIFFIRNLTIKCTYLQCVKVGFRMPLNLSVSTKYSKVYDIR